MSLPTLAELMSKEVSETFDRTPLPIGFYNGVITGAEARAGAKGPYLSVEVTIHDEEFKGRKVWKNSCSFSEKALGMPGGIANLLQTAKPDIPASAPPNTLPAVIAQGVISCPIRIEVEHEQVKRSGVFATLADGSPEMRSSIRQFTPPDDAFVQSIEAEAAGLDDDLPF
jgi:hypothetical protein